jgi:outer membrane receptor protein involved in Fe transport
MGLQAGASTYKDDSLWNYELGAKTRWLDGRFLANIAVYDIEWTGIQEIVVLPTCGFTATVNGAAARSQGSELELQFMPIQRLTLGLSGGYEDAHITAVAPHSSTLYVGQPLNGVPRWTGTTNATYEIPTAGFGKIFMRADCNYVGSSLSLNTSPVIGRTRPDYTLVDARIGTTLQHLELAAYAKNITNSRPNLGDEIPEVVALPNRPRYIIGPPRTVGLEASWRF